ncbi:dihydrolipoyl dehydrogenase family protein [Aestuariibius insulae]|uniref:dihydrolipoyl dehydrogenase family protein n=1 Tax=Aestuariibius insulae TaxID=2058287 RepID=UPI00398EFFB8
MVIGGGSAGISCATRASSLGAKVCLIERKNLGGTCVNRGCVPKKLMWEAGRVWKDARELETVGIAPNLGPFDLQALKTRISDKIEAIRESYASSLEDAGVTVLRADAELLDDKQVRVKGRILSAKNIVLATGGSPILLDIPGKDLLSTSRDVFEWTEIPKSLLVIGGGYIGCEFASIFRALGSDVCIVDAGDRLLEQFDEVAVGHAQDILTARGIKVRLSVEPTSLSKTAGKITVEFDSGPAEAVTHVLCAVGRSPNIDELGPVTESMERAENGALKVTDRLETSASGIYAIGDAADRLPLTPVATRDGEALADILFGEGARLVDLDLVSSATFLYPPIAQVGETESGTAFDGITTPLPSGVLSAETIEVYGKINSDSATGQLKGAVLIGHSAADEIAWIASCLAAGGRSEDLTKATAVHPTLAEEVVGRR